MNKLDKTQEGQTLLDNGNNYTPFEDPIAGATLQKVKQIVEELHQEVLLTKWPLNGYHRHLTHPEYLSSTLSQRFRQETLALPNEYHHSLIAYFSL